MWASKAEEFLSCVLAAAYVDTCEVLSALGELLGDLGLLGLLVLLLALGANLAEFFW